MTTGRKFKTEAIVARILAALTSDWQRASTICTTVYGQNLNYADKAGFQQMLYCHFRILVGRNLVERETRTIGGHRVNFYRRLQ